MKLSPTTSGYVLRYRPCLRCRSTSDTVDVSSRFRVFVFLAAFAIANVVALIWIHDLQTTLLVLGAHVIGIAIGLVLLRLFYLRRSA